MPSMGAGAAEGLQDVLQRLFLEAQLQQRQREQADEVGLRTRGLDLQGQNIDVDRQALAERRRQFDTARTDEQAAATAAAAASQRERDDAEAFEAGLPAHIRPLYHMSGHKLTNVKPDEFMNRPLTPAEADARAIAEEEAKHKIRTEGEARLIALRGAEDRRTQATQQEGTNPQRDATQDYANERATRTRQSVDELIGKVNHWTSGVGSVLSNIPATDARNFAAELATLKANVAFGELTEMRNASKTGGALGQVSNIELQLLESTLGALDAGQSPANLKAQLAKIRDSLDRWEKAKVQSGTVRVNPANLGGSAPAIKLDPLGIR